MTTGERTTEPKTDPMTWRINPQRAIVLDRPFLMGILNATPDSFSDGGRYDRAEAALEHARRMVGEGADLLDIGGESTRPGAQRVGAEEQIRRVAPVIGAIRAAGIGLPISVDTTLASVARAALEAGADIINDVSAASEDPEMLSLAASTGCGLILMHRERPPESDRYSDQYQRAPVAGSVAGRVMESLDARLAAASARGVVGEAIVLDPGLGFGKDVGQNLELINATPRLLGLGRPVLSALSRKSFVGRVSLGRDSEPSERLEGTLALSVLHLRLGARVLRVHDVGAHRSAVDAAWALVRLRG